MDKRKNNGGHHTAGRKAKNKEGRKITFTPSDEVLKIWDEWEDKTGMIERAMIDFASK